MRTDKEKATTNYDPGVFCLCHPGGPTTCRLSLLKTHCHIQQIQSNVKSSALLEISSFHSPLLSLGGELLEQRCQGPPHNDAERGKKALLQCRSQRFCLFLIFLRREMVFHTDSWTFSAVWYFSEPSFCFHPCGFFLIMWESGMGEGCGVNQTAPASALLDFTLVSFRNRHSTPARALYWYLECLSRGSSSSALILARSMWKRNIGFTVNLNLLHFSLARHPLNNLPTIQQH